VRPPMENPILGGHEIDAMQANSKLISFLYPA
jgi:hypothetical protein